MKYGLVYPTRRGGCIPSVVKMWESRAGRGAQFNWCVGINEDDADCLKVVQGLYLPHVAMGHDYVAACNAAAAKMVDSCDVVVVVSDDFVPPLRWNEALDAAIGQRPDRDFVVHVHDGGSGDLCTMPIVGVDRIKRFGWLFFPGYQSLFSDTELTYRAQLDDRLIEARHILFEHMHPVNKKRHEDDVDRAHASQQRWDDGKLLFNQRLAAGFPCERNPGDVPPVHMERYIASLQVTRDDICLRAVVDALFDGGVRNFMFNMPLQHWDGSEVSKSDHEQVVMVAKHLVARGAWYCRAGGDSLAPVFWPGMSRGQLETNYRNFCLARLRRLGFKHQLIVDGDEIFLPGGLATVDWSVRALQPSTAAVRGVPLAGLPAVAVEGATDRILCYMGPTDEWRDVRSPKQPTLDIPSVAVLHLSAVRRSRDEIIAKMRKSGHYDDELYHFEKWITETLPNLAPGMKNVHMYEDGSLWPLTRELTEREWRAIPEWMHPMIWCGPRVVQTIDTPDRKQWGLEKR